jgi:drug/metabolite transporter (DMT)-like permease
MDRPEPSTSTPPPIPVRLQRYEETANPPRRRFWLHPTSGLLILAVDWFFFAPEALSAEAAAIITSPLAFIITAMGVFWIQRRKNGDSFASAALKAFLGGFVAGIPTSIGGTILGTLVLILSGRSQWNQRRGDK